MKSDKMKDGVKKGKGLDKRQDAHANYMCRTKATVLPATHTSLPSQLKIGIDLDQGSNSQQGCDKNLHLSSSRGLRQENRLYSCHLLSKNFSMIPTERE